MVCGRGRKSAPPKTSSSSSLVEVKIGDVPVILALTSHMAGSEASNCGGVITELLDVGPASSISKLLPLTACVIELTAQRSFDRGRYGKAFSILNAEIGHRLQVGMTLRGPHGCWTMSRIVEKEVPLGW